MRTLISHFTLIFVMNVPAPWSCVKAYCFELILRVAALIQSPVGKQFSVCLWNRYQSGIVRNLGSY